MGSYCAGPIWILLKFIRVVASYRIGLADSTVQRHHDLCLWAVKEDLNVSIFAVGLADSHSSYRLAGCRKED
ncbi:hypothetical protein QVD17_41367 [Tagetes erecta]|uniref:Uncharacterized protein n=1 Tax=Tagetes erecta TaxID=13708 RepID=A0AAD8NEM0_TARER|nr:hypothetical protein QVD17_41367 [Tagetes erecta]